MEIKTVGLACDHAGYPLKKFVVQYLEEHGYPYKDYGTYSDLSCDYPDFAHALAEGIENGDVYPCAGWQAYVLGNVYEQSLQEIWEKSEKINELRKITQSAFPKCLKCEARNFCAMCLVRNFNESGGDMFKINDHFCKVAFLNKRLVEEYYSKQHV